MHRLNWIHESNQSDGPRLPCDHFDLIGGSGTGGLVFVSYALLRKTLILFSLIAILLGKLCMSVEEASEEFCKVIEQVYNSDGLTASERTASLRKCIEDIMKRKQLPIDLQLLAKQAGAGACFVVTSSRNNAKSTICLRSYPVRSQPPLSITIIDAVIATCAVQPDFAPITCGSGFRKREYIAANGAANPVNEVITEAHLLFGGDAKVASLLSLGTGNPGIISFPPTGSGPKLDRVMQDMMQDCERRAQEMEQRIGQVGIYCRLSVEQGMQSDQLEQMDDLSWIAAQTEDYLNRPDICEKLDLLVQNFGVEIGPISLDQLSACFHSPLYLVLIT
ncbi:hypothetical protein M408DRAFT_73758 [Serendipita vermifera MAFF 305830]|uniref:PNPLA domain-containing protein n=1 Tax=Serendipita vermifera MAFF 305830 TaxID=933852 RepID=A0A0C3AMN0_SERVB|nr:hypothetical protein M408DRAFT_73758 [Serendipita vermifera MAFF 305830]